MYAPFEMLWKSTVGNPPQPLPPLERRFLPRRDKLQESQGEASSLVQGWSYLFL